MKKLCILLVICFCFFTAIAEPASIDVTSLHDAELLQLLLSVRDEVLARNILGSGLEGQDMYPGIYVCGKELEPGSNDITIYGEFSTISWGIAESYDKFVSGETLFYDNLFSNQKGFHFSISEGQVFGLQVNGSAAFKYRKVG